MIQYKIGKYRPSDAMSDLICNNYPMLLVLNRFGIDLGFKEDSIEEVCKKHNVDIYTFLAVVNILLAENKRGLDIRYEEVSLSAIVSYLHNSHAYYLKYRLPSIRQKLVEALDRNDDISMIITNYYDEYTAEVHKHMMYEEETLFPYIEAMLSGTVPDKYNITMFCEHHDKVESKLSELKNIMIKYYPAKTTNEITSVLYDIFSCERDLASHNSIEDWLLVPAMKEFEKSKKQSR